MVRLFLALVLILIAGGVALYFVHAWRERNILRSRDEDE